MTYNLEWRAKCAVKLVSPTLFWLVNPCTLSTKAEISSAIFLKIKF
jgi:hypothetical protein